MPDAIELVVTCDENYLMPLRALIASAAINNPGERLRVHLLHSSVASSSLRLMERYSALFGVEFNDVRIDRQKFDEAYASKRYPQEMYYRMLAPLILDEVRDRMLYLDPDILVINPLRPLWDIDLVGTAFAAASHLDPEHPVTELNRLRLDTDHEYFNTGVILMDAPAARELIDPPELFAQTTEHDWSLLFPDQDVFNALYGRYTLCVPDSVWNYDARKYSDYLLRTAGQTSMSWVMEHTSILHFCGREKPWLPGAYHGRFDALYKNYAQIARRAWDGLAGAPDTTANEEAPCEN